ncbi:hypothetical protein D3C72_1996980 [compost metagenome]
MLAEAAAADPFKQRLEIGIPVAVPFLSQMKMVVAQLMLDDLLRLLMSICGQLMGIDLDVMTLHKISSACSGQPAVERCFMPKRQTEVLPRHPFNPVLKLFVRHAHEILFQSFR